MKQKLSSKKVGEKILLNAVGVRNNSWTSEETETTALAALAYMRARPGAAQVAGPINYLQNRRGAYGFATAKARVIRSREQLAVTVTFWRDRGRDDAVTLLRTALDRMDALDAALSIETIDPRAVDTLATRIGGACDACHTIYREQDPVTSEYRLRQSALQ